MCSAAECIGCCMVSVCKSWECGAMHTWPGIHIAAVLLSTTRTVTVCTTEWYRRDLGCDWLCNRQVGGCAAPCCMWHVAHICCTAHFGDHVVDSTCDLWVCARCVIHCRCPSRLCRALLPQGFHWPSLGASFRLPHPVAPPLLLPHLRAPPPSLPLT